MELKTVVVMILAVLHWWWWWWWGDGGVEKVTGTSSPLIISPITVPYVCVYVYVREPVCVSPYSVSWSHKHQHTNTTRFTPVLSRSRGGSKRVTNRSHTQHTCTSPTQCNRWFWGSLSTTLPAAEQHPPVTSVWSALRQKELANLTISWHPASLHVLS